MLAEMRRISDTAFDLEERLSDIRQRREAVQRQITIGNQAVFVILIALFAVLVVRRVLAPMDRLQGTATAVESGDLTARTGYRSNDEFGDLSRVFDTMIQSLQERDAAQNATTARLSASEASLAAARRDLQKILDATPSMIGYWDRRLTCRFANRAFEDWFGASLQAMPGMHMRDLLGAARFQESLPQAEAAERSDWRARRKPAACSMWNWRSRCATRRGCRHRPPCRPPVRADWRRCISSWWTTAR